MKIIEEDQEVVVTTVSRNLAQVNRKGTLQKKNRK